MLSLYGDIPELIKFDVKQLIGKGCFGQVRKAYNKETKKDVALKFIDKKFRKKSQINREKQEFQLLKRLAQHQYVIKGYSLIDSRDWVIIQTQLADGDLATYQEKQRNGRLEESQIRRIAKQLLLALKQMHRNNIVHRDLKPQNILMKGKDVRLCDFGFAKDLQSKDFFTSMKGTPLYIAPQMISGKSNGKFSPKVDIWAYGIILFEMATGKPPFYQQQIHRLFPKIQKQQFKCPNYMSSSLKSLIQQILKSPEVSRPSWEQIENHQFFAQGTLQIYDNINQTKLIRKNSLKTDRDPSVESPTKIKAIIKKNNIYTDPDKLQNIKKNIPRQTSRQKSRDQSKGQKTNLKFRSPQQTVRMNGKCQKNVFVSPPKQFSTLRPNIHTNLFEDKLLFQAQDFQKVQSDCLPTPLKYVKERVPRFCSRENQNQKRKRANSPYPNPQNLQQNRFDKNKINRIIQTNGAVQAIQEIQKHFSSQNKDFYTMELKKNQNFYLSVRQVLAYASHQKQQNIYQSDYQLTRARGVKTRVSNKTLIFLLRLLQNIYRESHQKKLAIKFRNPQQYEDLFSENRDFLQDLVTLSLEYQENAQALAQIYKTLIFALKSNFDNAQVDLKVAQDIIQNLTKRNFYMGFELHKQPGKIRMNSGIINSRFQQNHSEMNQLSHNSLITIGVLANQAILTLGGPSDDFFALLDHYGCLEKVTSLFKNNERTHRTILQLLVNFVNPSLQAHNKKYNMKNVLKNKLRNQTTVVLHKLKRDIALTLQKVGLIGSQSPVQVYQNFADIQLYMKILYQCMKHPQCKEIHKNYLKCINYWIQISRMYPKLLVLTLAQNNYLIKYENQSIIENELKQILKTDLNPMIQVFSPGYFYFEASKNFRSSKQQNRQKFQYKIKQLLQIIKQDYLKQDGSLPKTLTNKNFIKVTQDAQSDSDQLQQMQQLGQNIENQLLCNYYPYYDILIDLLCKIIIQNRNAVDIVKSAFRLIIENLKTHKRRINISEKTFQKVLICSDYSTDIKDLNHGHGKKFADKILQIFSIHMLQGFFKSYEQRQDLRIQFSRQIAFRMIKLMLRIIMLMPPQQVQKIYKIAQYTQKGEFLKYILTPHFIDNKEINLRLSLSFTNKIITKCHNQTLSFLALRVPSLVSPFFCQYSDLTIEILAFFSTIAKQTQENYDPIAKSGIVEYLPQYIKETLENQDNDAQFRESQIILDKTLILIGNMCRYSTFFFKSFKLYRIMDLIIRCFRKYYQHSSYVNKNLMEEDFELQLTRKQSKKINQRAGTFKIKRSLLYAIGNMTFYDNTFHSQIIELLPEMLQVIMNTKSTDDYDLANNAIATFINLIRITPRCIKQFLEYRVIQQVLGFAENFSRQSFQSFHQLEKTINKFFEKVSKEFYQYPQAQDLWLRVERYFKQRSSDPEKHRQLSGQKRIRFYQSPQRATF